MNDPREALHCRLLAANMSDRWGAEVNGQRVNDAAVKAQEAGRYSANPPSRSSENRVRKRRSGRTGADASVRAYLRGGTTETTPFLLHCHELLVRHGLPVFSWLAKISIPATRPCA